MIPLFSSLTPPPDPIASCLSFFGATSTMRDLGFQPLGKGTPPGSVSIAVGGALFFFPATSCPLRLLSPKPFVYLCQNQAGAPPLPGLLTLAEEAHLTFLPSFRFPSLTKQRARRNLSSHFMEESKTQKHCLMRDLEPRSPDSQAPQTMYLSL